MDLTVITLNTHRSSTKYAKFFEQVTLLIDQESNHQVIID